MFNKLKPLAALIAAALISTSALAATQTLDAGNYTISYDDAALGLFGTPTLTAGGDLLFQPTDFKAYSSSGFGLTSSTFGITITADANFALTSLGLAEYGDYLKTNAANTVSVAGQLVAWDQANPALRYTNKLVAAGVLNQVSSDASSTTDWSASAGLDQLRMSTAKVTIENILTAKTPSRFNGDEISFIEKKGVLLDINVTPVPEPQSLAMLLAGLGIVGAVARRRRIGA